jgi:hypothetical protein
MSDNPDFGTFGRYKELLIEEMNPDQKKAYEFTMKERGQVPGPYKIWLQNPKLIDVMVPLGAYYQGHSSLSKAEIEIATNLTNARWLAGQGLRITGSPDLQAYEGFPRGNWYRGLRRNASSPRSTSPGAPVAATG